MTNTHFDDQGRFVLPGYPHRPPFASFLPGIAGPLGIPMWVFYVNRGQGIAAFGVESKDAAIMEFVPANKAYRQVCQTGFRTFLKLNGAVYEPFAPHPTIETQRQMAIGMNELELLEICPAHGLQTNVLYFTLTGEPFAGLARQITLTNLGSEPVELSVLDGLPVILPFGVENWLAKDLARTAEAWMGVFNLERNVPFYRVRSSIVDRVEVERYEAGHFYLAFTSDGPLPAIVDPDVVFGADTSLSHPDQFLAHSLDDLFQARQITVGKTPCGFFGTQKTLGPGESLTLYGIIGHASSLEMLYRHTVRISQPAYLNEQRDRANVLVRDLTDTVAIHTSEPLFDAYVRQSFLDNVLRGGWPVLLGDVVQHLYSRKHGDLERDYNAFYLAPEFYSQGNGNYRDVNQNRREDVWLNPRVEDYNIMSFMNLIQADGYNPLVIYGNRFSLPADRHAAVLALVENPAQLEPFLAKPFTPGALLKFITMAGITLRLPPEDFLALVLKHADRQFEAVFGEGYWTDHWTYNLDLIDNYLSIYPDRKTDLLFGRPIYTFFDSPAVVQPRRSKHVLAQGRVRQLNAIHEDEEKAALIASRPHHPTALRAEHGQGEIVVTTLFVKLVSLALIKFASLDPSGMGIEMEAGKPGWYDALNGLPGLFGSSMPETFELDRLLTFLRASLAEQDQTILIVLPAEVSQLLHEVDNALKIDGHPMLYWETVTTARETYRAHTRLGFEGTTQSLPLRDLDAILDRFQQKVHAGIEQAQAANDGIPPTYLIHHVEAYEVVDHDTGSVRITRFKPEILPLFLEGPVRALKNITDPAGARQLHERVKASNLFDRALKMYKVNASLNEQPLDIGRARAFTPGWLENESIWLHMEYKYLLAMLKAGLVEEFYEDFRHVLIPFQDPARYGRSPLENSSFIVSSAHPDSSLHGRGFVARLSGCTVEFLSILHRILIGERPFVMQDGALVLRFDPALPGWLFDAEGQLSFTFLGKITVEYHNPDRRDTSGDGGVHPAQITLFTPAGEAVPLDGNLIPSPYAEQVRNGEFTRIQIVLR